MLYGSLCSFREVEYQEDHPRCCHHFDLPGDLHEELAPKDSLSSNLRVHFSFDQPSLPEWPVTSEGSLDAFAFSGQKLAFFSHAIVNFCLKHYSSFSIDGSTV